MTSWNPQANELFLSARELSSSEQRHAFLDRVCADNAELRAEVESLLAAGDRAGEFLQSPIPAMTGVLSSGSEGPGTIVGSYKLLEQIGEGGFGAVYMAEQTQPVRRRVALKILKPGMDTRQVVARFEAERQALAIMDHPNIAKVFDGGATNSGRPFFVMELVKGVPLTSFCDLNHLAPRQRLELFISVCHAVQHAHQKGIIHRDLKPSNVLVTVHDTTPVVKVIDFGVAKAMGQALTDKTLFTGFAQMIGTPLYMSPEQAGQSGLDVDTRSDIYSLGVLLYELLTGSTPFDKERFQKAGYDEICRIIREEEPPRPSTRLSELGRSGRATRTGIFHPSSLASVSASRQMEPAKLMSLFRGEVDWIVMKALEKDRNRRYETANSFAADVQRFLDDEPVLACPPSARYRLRKFVHRNRGPVAAGLALATLLVLGTVGTSIGLAWALRAEEKATSAADAEIQAKRELKKTLDAEVQDGYFRRIELAYTALAVNNLGRALELLLACPEELRGWEWRYLMRLCRVEPEIIRDLRAIHSVAFSRDGERLASSGEDGAVKVWNARTGKWLKTIPAHKGIASSIAFHPESTHLASVGADNPPGVKVWDLTTDPPVAVFEKPCDAVRTFGTAYTAAFSPLHPDHLAVGFEGAVTIWNWRTRQAVHTFVEGGNHRISLAFSRDGRHLATGSWLA